MKNFIELSTGDFINLEEIIYIHLAKTSECAYIYVKNLYHSSDEAASGSSKRITISLEDYDKIRAILSNWTQHPVTLNETTC